MTPKFHDLTVIDVRPETDDTISVAFAIPEELSADYSYKAGQYLTLRAMVNNEDIRRSYSICTAPNENEWRVAIKRIENGAFSSWAKESLKAGDRMQVMTPTGHFAFTPDPTVSQSYLLVAAGSGITPILSIVKTILTEEPLSDVTLVYGNKGFHSIIFREELEALKNKHLDRFRLIHVLSRESLGNALQKGRIDLDKVTKLNKAFFANQPIHGVYVCGPEEMIHAVKDGMMQAGIDEKNIHFELFATSTPIIKPAERVSNEPTVDSMVTIILDGDQLEIPLNSDGTSILDSAQAAGSVLPFACKGGVCCTCKANTAFTGKRKICSGSLSGIQDRSSVRIQWNFQLITVQNNRYH